MFGCSFEENKPDGRKICLIMNIRAAAGYLIL